MLGRILVVRLTLTAGGGEMIVLDVPSGGGGNAVQASPELFDVTEVLNLVVSGLPNASDAVRLWSISAGNYVSYWFSINGTGSNPDTGGSGSTEVALSSSFTVAQVVSALVDAINATGPLSAASVGGTTVVVTESVPGEGHRPVSDVNQLVSNVSAEVATEGQSATPRMIEAIDGSLVTGVDAAKLEGNSLVQVLGQADNGAATLARSLRGYAAVATASASNSAAITFNTVFSTLPSDFDDYVVVIDNLAPATDNVTFRAVLTNNGVDLTGTYRWAHNNLPLHSGAASNTTLQNGTTGWPVLGTTLGNALNEINTVVMQLFVRRSGWPHMFWSGMQINLNTQGTMLNGGGIYEQNVNPTGIRFLMSSGNIATGRFTILGRKKTAAV